MRAFCELYEELDTTRSTREQVDAMVRYFRSAPAADAAWATYILSGRRLRRFVGPALMHRWLREASGLPEWLLEASCTSVGDLAETIALLMESNAERAADIPDVPLATWIDARLLPLRDADEGQQGREIVGWWRALPYRECLLINKLLTGQLRVRVSQQLLTRALAQALQVPEADLARRMTGEWMPSEAFWEQLLSGSASTEAAAPYPFFTAAPLECEPSQLGEIGDWLIEWKWDGIRGQLIRRRGRCFLWSGDGELVTERFPELAAAAARLPEGVVLDGEIVAWREGVVLPFAELQQRTGRKALTRSILERVSVRFLAFDLLEADGADVRAQPLEQRRGRLQRLLDTTSGMIGLSPEVHAASWPELAMIREQSRLRCVEGLMLKARHAAYASGGQRGAWWMWQADPHSFEGVMLYAQPGHGRRSDLYTDYTFGVWDGAELVPITKAHSGLSEPEINALDRWIRAHTQEKFGPVRKVEPSQVFELAFEGIVASTRHKSGIALRSPRIVRWRTGKPAAEAGSLGELHEILESHRERA
jgi:DNA ligase-1